MLTDRLGVAIQYLAAIARSKYEPPTLPRPVTARRELWLEDNLARHRSRVSRMLPAAPPEEVA